MPTHEQPRIRPYLLPFQKPFDPAHIYLVDQLGLLPDVRLTYRDFLPLRFLDGKHTLREVQAEVIRARDGVIIPLETLSTLIDRLDRAALLDGPRFRAVADSPVREPRCIAAIDPDVLRQHFHYLFTHPKGPGLPRGGMADGSLRAALIPHMDYERGGITYTWGYKEVFERTHASLFVIIGTSHYGADPRTLGRTTNKRMRFTLTRKDFKTPLGIAPTDQEYIDRLVRHYGDGLFEDELMHHLPEHSIELEVVFLQYLYEKVRPIRIVPLVVGPFHDCVASGDPAAHEDIQRLVEALRRTEEEIREPICYIISGDLAHIGPKFGDAALTHQRLAHSRDQDHAILRQTENADPLAFFRVIADEGDCRNICGLPPTYTTLAAARPGRGKVLHYDQYIEPRRLFESVSFASVAFYR